MKIYITGLPSGYEVEHLVRLFYPMAPLTLTPPENAEDCVWAEKTPDGLHALVRQDGRSAERHAPLPAPVEQGGETPEFSLASLTYDLLRDWTGIRPPWGKMTGVRPVRLIHDKRAAGWTEAEIDHFFLDRFDCSQQKYQMAKAIADLQEPILKVGNEPGTYSLYIGIPFCPSRCSYCSFVSCNLDRDRKMVQPYVDCLCREVEEIRIQADKAGLKLCSIYIGGGTPTSLSADQLRQLMGTVRANFDLSRSWNIRWKQAVRTARMPKSWRSSRNTALPASPSTRRPSRTRCWRALGASTRRRTFWTAMPKRARPVMMISTWT